MNSEIGKAFFNHMLFGSYTGKEAQVLRNTYDKNLKIQPVDRQVEALEAKVAQLEQQLKNK